jgi:hypothetical protein
MERQVMNQKEEWSEDDATWKLLGKASKPTVSIRFTDDTIRAIRQLPAPLPWWRTMHFLAPVGFASCCAAICLFLSLHTKTDAPSSAHVGSESSWQEIEATAHQEILIAASQHLDSFSDEELFSLVGF